MSRDFWLACGHHLLDRDFEGRLILTDEFLKVYFARPELKPPENACAAEVAMREILLAEPRRVVTPAQIAAIADIDARDNWQLVLAWRDHLLAYPTLEAAYLDIALRRKTFPHVFINQLVQVVLRNILDDVEDTCVLRAAELFFRSQKLVASQGSLLSADEETYAQLSAQPASPISALLGLTVGGQLDVLNSGNAESYFERSDRFDLALDLTGGRAGLAALGEVMTRWVRHMLGIDISLLPLTEVRDVSLKWYVGLDADATRLGDDLWAGRAWDEAGKRQLVGLYELNFLDHAEMDERLEGEPCFVLMAMSPDMTLTVKPQNILAGLPLKRPDTVQ